MTTINCNKRRVSSFKNHFSICAILSKFLSYNVLQISFDHLRQKNSSDIYEIFPWNKFPSLFSLLSNDANRKCISFWNIFRGSIEKCNSTSWNQFRIRLKINFTIILWLLALNNMYGLPGKDVSIIQVLVLHRNML